MPRELVEEEIILENDEGWVELDYIDKETSFNEVDFLSLQTPKEKEEEKRKASS